MNENILTNKLSIYLIKERCLSHSDILRNYDSLEVRQINDNCVLYYGESHSFAPSWIGKFFKDSSSNEYSISGIFSSSAKAILLVEIEIDECDKRIFAIPFGYGWTLLNLGTFEERFGLKVTLNVIDSAGLRQIGKKNLSSNPKDTKEQLSKAGVAADFTIDIEQDLILSITGRSREETYGRMVSGKDALSISAKIDISNIEEFLRNCYDVYMSDDYKKDFGFIDQISELKDKRLIDELNNYMIRNINDGKMDNIWMAVPEIVEWHEIEGFAYSNKKDNLKNDIDILDFIDSLPQHKKDPIELVIFENKKIYCFSASSDEQRFGPWKAFNCLYCEISDKDRGKIYLLSNGNWYEVENDFVNEVNKDYRELRDMPSKVELPPYNHENEADYNQKAAQDNEDLCCMDRKLIIYGGAHSSIEFCDLLSTDKDIIHVKRYGGSSMLSHLFSQGTVSAELFLSDKEFRRKLNEILPDGRKLVDPEARITSDDYQVVFAIVSSSKNQLELPFFSKVALKNAKRRLEAFGYKVALMKSSMRVDII